MWGAHIPGRQWGPHQPHSTGSPLIFNIVNGMAYLKPTLPPLSPSQQRRPAPGDEATERTRSGQICGAPAQTRAQTRGQTSCA